MLLDPTVYDGDKDGAGIVTMFNRCAVLCACLLAAGCASLAPKTPEEIVGTRALDQAQALMEGDFERALSYMTPSYQASPRSADYERNRAGAGSWTDVQLKWVKCNQEQELCEVRLIIRAMRPPAMTVPIPIPLDDTWIFIDGSWYQYE